MEWTKYRICYDGTGDSYKGGGSHYWLWAFSYEDAKNRFKALENKPIFKIQTLEEVKAQEEKEEREHLNYLKEKEEEKKKRDERTQARNEKGAQEMGMTVENYKKYKNALKSARTFDNKIERTKKEIERLQEEIKEYQARAKEWYNIAEEIKGIE